MKDRIQRIENEVRQHMGLSLASTEWLIDTVKQQLAVIEENKRQEEIAVNQFKQAQQDIRRLSGESSRYKKALQQVIKNLQFTITAAKNELEGENS
ncbi:MULTISPECIES: hypothetical protein [Bacillus subtilis group]|uniref:hypothetical protein n=1 Tax=Bacillus subtilis group TaxID=653685 RepID=UPI000348D345|nr:MULTISPECIES: hypothetical protein [Bacillus subtilis group]AWX20921.1 hypothetical protein CXF51_01080 [Bacillus subtilis subsp. subtilis]KIN37588.1 hypothetical protein B4070_2546 [Bacillus subtilis]KMN93474.1 hypothetical protein VL08_17715 [Bacillus subtilis]MCW0121660.1 hypothetical protein [Bacillus subtilis]MDP8527877.1 hypothetical protein [Bacillus subtilis]